MSRRFVFLGAFVMVFVWAGCGSSPASASSAILLTATTVAFPTTAVGDTATATVTLSTTSDQTIGLSDSDTANFPYSTTCATSLPAGSTCSITLQFHPNVVGNLEAWLTVNAASGKPTPIALTGTATGTAAASNIGAPSPISLLQIVTAEPNPFYLAPGQTSQLSGSAILNGGGVQDVTAAATWTSSDPTVASVSPSGLVTALSGGTTSVSIAYLGHFASIRVLVVGTIVLAPTSAQFPVTVIGQTSMSQMLTVTFAGGPNGIGSVSSSSPTEFFVVSTTCDETAAHAAGYACTMLIAFTPHASGQRTAQLTITSAEWPASTPATATLTGVGE